MTALRICLALLSLLIGLAAAPPAGAQTESGVSLRVTAMDETNTRVRVDRLVRAMRGQGGRALVGLVGVQSNQYPRALDIARQFRARAAQWQDWPEIAVVSHWGFLLRLTGKSLTNAEMLRFDPTE